MMAYEWARKPRTATSAATVLLVLDELVAACRAEGVTHITVDELAQMVGQQKLRLAGEHAVCQLD